MKRPDLNMSAGGASRCCVFVGTQLRQNPESTSKHVQTPGKVQGQKQLQGQGRHEPKQTKHQTGTTLHFRPLSIIYGVEDFLSNLNDALLIQQDLNFYSHTMSN